MLQESVANSDGATEAKQPVGETAVLALVGRLLQEQRVRLIELIGGSEFSGDRTAEEELLSEFDQSGVEGLRVTIAETAESLVAASDALKRARWARYGGLLVKMAALISGAVFLTVAVLADSLFGPDGFPDSAPPGWRGVLYNASIISVFTGMVFGIWWFNLDNRNSEQIKERVERLRQEISDQAEDRFTRPILTKFVNRRAAPTFSSRLLDFDTAPLAGATPYEPVSTSSLAQLLDVIGSTDSGTIGLCGPRGVGKTTAIRSLCSKNATDEKLISFSLDAPVNYDPVAFVSTLMNTLLREVSKTVLGREGVPRDRRRLSDRVLTILLPLAALASSLVWLSTDWDLGRTISILEYEPSSIPPTAVILLAIFIGMGLSVYVLRHRATRMVRDIEPVVALAAARLYGTTTIGQQRSSVIPVLGISVGRSKSMSISQAPLDLPALRLLLEQVVAALVRHGWRLRIGIDELDKIPPDEARTFLNGLKVVFGLDFTHFIVSVSEDAMSDFERRGIPLRDAFDSSLDEVVRIEELSVDESMLLLGGRGKLGIPLSFGCLCHCFSGGVPRELLRVARKLVRANASLYGADNFGSMAALCAMLIADDLRAKSNAVWIVARSVEVEPFSTRFRAWLALSDEEAHSADSMLNASAVFSRAKPLDLSMVSGEVQRQQIERLSKLALEFAGYRYFAATVSEFFTKSSDADLRAAIQQDSGVRGIRALSVARLTFADDPRLAWNLVSQFRAAHGLEPILAVPTEGFILPPGQTGPGSGSAQPAAFISDS